MILDTKGKRIVCIIPARLGSYRFPNKPFADICGKSMLEHVCKRAQLCDIFEEIYITTPNEEIREHVANFGGKTIMTTDDVRRASDRVAQAAEKIEPADIIVNLQGDEPLVRPDILAAATKPLLEDDSLSCVSLVRKVAYDEAIDIHDCKIVFDVENLALYISREPIPSKFMGDKKIDYYIGLGIFPFTQKSLRDFASLPSTPLEIIESMDMNRFLEHRRKIKIVETDHKAYSIDVPSDVKKVVEVMENDDLFGSY